MAATTRVEPRRCRVSLDPRLGSQGRRPAEYFVGARKVVVVCGPDGPSSAGPDLRRPREHLRILPGKCAGEPHLDGSRLTTVTIAALAGRGYSLDDVTRLYPDDSRESLAEAIDLEHSLGTLVSAAEAAASAVWLALDQNFPTPILVALAEFIVDIELIPLPRIDPRPSSLDDRTLVIALHQLGFPGLVTNNYKMLKNPRSWPQSSPPNSPCS